MKCFGFDDLFIGMSAQFKRKIDGEMIDSFAQVSGDSNPLHIDSDYARRSGFKDQIAHGMLCTSLSSEPKSTSSGCAVITRIFIRP